MSCDVSKHPTKDARDDCGVSGPPLRNIPAMLSKRDIVKMVAEKCFHHASDLSRYGLARAIRGRSFHLFEPRLVLGDSIVIDHLFGTIWQLSGSHERITWVAAHEHARELRKTKFAGSSLWRLPTIEELASLIEFDKQEQGLHINVLFASEQRTCWSADRDPSVGAAWGVHFDNGTVTRGYPEHLGYARLVCSGTGVI